MCKLGWILICLLSLFNTWPSMERKNSQVTFFFYLKVVFLNSSGEFFCNLDGWHSLTNSRMLGNFDTSL